MPNTVIIDCFPESARRYLRGYAAVSIDVIRATTTAITAAAEGWRCFPVPDLESAFELAARVENPLLAGELQGDMPAGFHLNNSPTELLEQTDTRRPLILLSSSGTRLMHEANSCDAQYLACFRNYIAVADYLAGTHSRIAVLGAGSRNQFRAEDQMCCAWIAERLMSAGYAAEDRRTHDLVKRWSGVSPEACVAFKSADYLRRSGQERDLEFVLTHVNDLREVFTLEAGEVVLAEEPVAYAHG